MPGSVIVSANVAETCNPDSTRTVDFIAIAIGGSGPNAHWDFGDGEVSPLNFPLTNVVVWDSHDYMPGNWIATLVIDGCPDEAIPVAVPECPPSMCPDVFIWASPDTEDCIGNLMDVALNVFNPGPGGQNAQWEFGDGSPDENIVIPENDGATVHHNYVAPGDYTATLHIDGCPNQSVMFTVPACPPDDNGGNGDGDNGDDGGDDNGDGGDDGGFCGSLICCILCAIWSILLAGYIIGLGGPVCS